MNARFSRTPSLRACLSAPSDAHVFLAQFSTRADCKMSAVKLRVQADLASWAGCSAGYDCMGWSDGRESVTSGCAFRKPAEIVAVAGPMQRVTQAGCTQAVGRHVSGGVGSRVGRSPGGWCVCRYALLMKRNVGPWRIRDGQRDQGLDCKAARCRTGTRLMPLCRQQNCGAVELAGGWTDEVGAFV